MCCDLTLDSFGLGFGSGTGSSGGGDIIVPVMILDSDDPDNLTWKEVTVDVEPDGTPITPIVIYVAVPT